MKKSIYITLITCSSLLIIPTACSPTQTTNHNQSALAAKEVSTESLQQTASIITVKVSAGSSSGSGVLIAQAGNTYTVVTNAHVIGRGNNYQITTVDGKTHQATLKKGDRSDKDDLALLQFQATDKYTIATLGNAKQVNPNQPVFAVGFGDGEEQLTFNSGKVERISHKPLVGGYQIGFTNTTKQGMSGGALLNEEGKVIGILGLGAGAILDNAYLYADNSRPDTQMLEQLRANSFAVPVTQIASSIVSKQEKETQERTQSKITPSKKYTGLPGKIDNIAQKITVRIDSKNNGNGSGVIVAHDGDTYYVVTAGHVVTNEDDYTIVTPDGQSYPIENSSIKTFEGIDLAVIQFTSKESYSTATLANYINNPDYNNPHNISSLDYSQSRFGSWIFVSGFPGNQKERSLSAGNPAILGGIWSSALAKDSFSLTNGNELLYTNTSLPGMSGGAILDSEGRLIGINTGAENEYVEAKTGQYKEVALGYSLGIPIKNFLNLAKSANIPSIALKQKNSLTLGLTELEIDSIKSQLFAFRTPEKNATETDWLNYGNQLWRASEDFEAVKAFDRAIAINPQEYRAYYGKGLAYESVNNQKAIDPFRQATKINPDFYAAWKELADKLSSGDLENRTYLLETLAAYNQAIQLEPKIFTNYIKRGRVLDNLKRYDEAITSYNQSIKLQPVSTAYLGRGDVYYDLKKYKFALRDYKQAKKLNAGDLDFNVSIDDAIGNAYNKLKDYKSAIAILSQSIEEAPKIQTSIYSDLYFHRGIAYKNLKEYQLALADYNQAIKLAFAIPKAKFYLTRALLYYDLKDVQKGDQDLEEGIRLLKKELSYGDEARVKNIANNFNKAGKPKAAQKIQKLISYIKTSEYTSQASKMEALDKRQEAIKLYTKAIEINPDDQSSYFERGKVYEELENYQAALADYTKAIEVNPDNFDDDSYYWYRGMVFYHKLKDYQAAIADYTKAIEINPGYIYAYESRSEVYEKLKDYQAAIADYTKVIEIIPHDVDNYNDRGSLYEASKDYQAAIADYTKAIETDPDDSDSLNYKNRGSLYEKLKDYQSAIADYTKAIETNIDYGDTSNFGMISLYNDRANIHEELKDYQSAIADYTKTIELDSNSSDAYNKRGLVYYEQGNYQAAIADYTKAIEIDTKVNATDLNYRDIPFYRDILNYEIFSLYNQRGLAYIDLKDYQSAIADYTKAIEIAPSSSDTYNLKYESAYINRGWVYEQQGKVDLALADYNQAIKINPNYALAYNSRGLIYYNQGKVDLALADYNRAIKLDSNLVYAHNNRGDLYNDSKEYLAAINNYNKAIEINPNYVEAYNSRGNVYYSLKEYQAAIADYNKAIKINPNYAHGYRNLGLALAHLENYQSATVNYQKAAQLFQKQGNTEYYQQVQQELKELQRSIR